MALDPIVARVTDRIVARSAHTRAAYLDLIARVRDNGLNRPQTVVWQSGTWLCRCGR